MIEILHSTDLDAQRSSAEVINIIKSHAAVDALLEHLDNPDPNVSFACIEALGSIGDFKAVQPLIQLFKESDDLREVSIESLGKILSRKVPDELIDSLYEDDPIVVYSIVDSLGRIGEPKALDKLIDIFPRSDELIQSEILKAIGKIIRSSRYFILPEMLLSVVINDFEAEDLQGKKDLLPILSRINSPDALTFLVDKYETEEDEIWQENIYISIVNFLTVYPEKGIRYLSAIEDEDTQAWFIGHFPGTKQWMLFNYISQELAQKAELRQAAVYYSSQFKIKESYDYVLNILNSGDENNIAIVLQALQTIRIREIEYALIALLKSANYEWIDILTELFEIHQSELDIHLLAEAYDGLNDYGKMKLLNFLPDKISGNKKLLISFLSNENPEIVKQVLGIVATNINEFSRNDILPLAQLPDPEIGQELIRILGQYFNNDLNRLMVNSIDQPDLLLGYLEVCLEENTSFFPETLLNCLKKGNDQVKPLVRQLMLFSGDENVHKNLASDLKNLPSEELDYYLDVAAGHSRYDFIKLLLSKISGHDDLKEKYAAYFEGNN